MTNVCLKTIFCKTTAYLWNVFGCVTFFMSMIISMMAWHYNPTPYGDGVNPYSVPAHDSREAAGSDTAEEITDGADSWRTTEKPERKT